MCKEAKRFSETLIYLETKLKLSEEKHKNLETSFKSISEEKKILETSFDKIKAELSRVNLAFENISKESRIFAKDAILAAEIDWENKIIIVENKLKQAIIDKNLSESNLELVVKDLKDLKLKSVSGEKCD